MAGQNSFRSMNGWVPGVIRVTAAGTRQVRRGAGLSTEQRAEEGAHGTRHLSPASRAVPSCTDSVWERTGRSTSCEYATENTNARCAPHRSTLHRARGSWSRSTRRADSQMYAFSPPASARYTVARSSLQIPTCERWTCARRSDRLTSRCLSSRSESRDRAPASDTSIAPAAREPTSGTGATPTRPRTP